MFLLAQEINIGHISIIKNRFFIYIFILMFKSGDQGSIIDRTRICPCSVSIFVAKNGYSSFFGNSIKAKPALGPAVKITSLLSTVAHAVIPEQAACVASPNL